MGMNLHNKEFLDLKLFQTFRVSSAFNMHDLIKVRICGECKGDVLGSKWNDTRQAKSIFIREKT